MKVIENGVYRKLNAKEVEQFNLMNNSSSIEENATSNDNALINDLLKRIEELEKKQK